MKLPMSFKPFSRSSALTVLLVVTLTCCQNAVKAQACTPVTSTLTLGGGVITGYDTEFPFDAIRAYCDGNIISLIVDESYNDQVYDVYFKGTNEASAGTKKYTRNGRGSGSPDTLMFQFPMTAPVIGYYEIRTHKTGCLNEVSLNDLYVHGLKANPNDLTAFAGLSGQQGIYCEGEGMGIGITQTYEEQIYTWVLDGTGSVFSTKGTGKKGGTAGGGGAQSYGISNIASYQSGVYYVVTSIPGCPAGQTIQYRDVNVLVNGAPAPQTVIGGGMFCDGVPFTSKTLSIQSTAPEFTYDLLKKDGTSYITVSSVVGTGSAINFPAITEAGTYLVQGYRNTCPLNPTTDFGETIISDFVPHDLYSANMENFDYTIPTLLPDCWSLQTVSGSAAPTTEKQSAAPFAKPYQGTAFLLWKSSSIPAGQSTRVVTRAINTLGYNSADVEFLWLNSNINAYSTGNYLNEGLQVQYSLDGISWVDAGTFIPRHDPGLPSGTSLWQYKKVTLPAAFGNKAKVYLGFVFRSENGRDCGIDYITFRPSSGCGQISSISVSAVTTNSASFSWPAVPGATSYTYRIDNENMGAYPGTDQTGTTLTYNNLSPNLQYHIEVSPTCPTGKGTPFIQPFLSQIDCNQTTLLYECNDQVTSLNYGTGNWNFSGSYPNNSNGTSTAGRERIFRFIPAQTGVYYLSVKSVSGAIDYLYKPVSAGCGNTGWTGIGQVLTTGNKAIGLLTKDVQYYIMTDNPNPGSVASQRFGICLAGLSAPSAYNTCITTMHSAPISANSSKEEFFVDELGNLVASLDFSGVTNSVGTVTVSYNVNNGPIRRDSYKKEYLDRNYTITTTNAPANFVGVKLYFTNDDLQRLINEPDDGIADVSSLSALNITRTSSGCNTVFSTSSPATLIPQAGNGTVGAVGSYVMFNSPGFSSFFLNAGLNALPLKIEYFNGEQTAGGAVLHWKISCPGSNGVTIDVQRSTDGLHFSSIGSIRSDEGRCAAPFEYTDGNAGQQTVYYRLNLTEGTGGSAYSGTLMLSGDLASVLITGIQPNPVQGKKAIVNMVSPKASRMSLVVSDIYGRNVRSQVVQLMKGSNQVSLALDGLAAGYYILSGISADGPIPAIKFILE